MSSKRNIIIIDFPYYDAVNSKKRPVLIIGEKGEDYIICAITSNPLTEGIPITFESGTLPLESNIKYWQIQTILRNRAGRTLAKISKSCYDETIRKIHTLMKI